MIFSYRTRKALGRFFGIVLTVVLVAVALVLLWLLWLQRFVVYTPQGAVFDFSYQKDTAQAVEAKPARPGVDIDIWYGAADGPEETEKGLEQLTGYYVTVEQLQEDLQQVQQKLLSLPKGTPVLLDVKGIWGLFYYSTKVGDSTSSSFDMDTMDAFFASVNAAGLYTIARLPAFRDNDFARKHQSCGLTATGGYLYAGADKCYWLEPDNETVLTYLIQVTKELQKMGFDEVVFKDFCFPDTDKLSFDGDRAAVIAKAAESLATACAGKGFVVSFLTSDMDFALPDGNCRLYLENVAAAELEATLGLLGLKDSDQRVVVLAQTNDTRYDICGCLRPIDLAV